MADSARALVESVLTRNMAKEIWTGDYDKALPVSLQEYELSAVLPAVFYMFRFGERRGIGNFLRTFGSSTGTPAQKRRSVTVERIAERLADSSDLTGFDGEAEKAVLGDLLLCYCLENVKHSQGRDQQVQRVAPAHYMASWVDLPQSVAHLRHIPEMIVAMLADQKGACVEVNKEGDRTRFPVGKGYENNVLLHTFSQGVTRRGALLEDLSSDQFNDKDHSVGLDQLLMIRLAQQLGSAPHKVRGKEGSGISNQRPIAEQAARDFSDDIRRFLRAYSVSSPRHALVEMLESCIAVGMTTILSSTVEILSHWADTGAVSERREQRPPRVFVDCSNGIDRRSRDWAEQSMDELMRRMERVPTVLMVLRLLDYQAGSNREISKDKTPTRPYATEWLNLLGDVLHERHTEASHIHYNIEEKVVRLAEELAEDYAEAAAILRNEDSQPNLVWRLARGLTTLIGPKFLQGRFSRFIDSSLLTGRPNGLAVKRKTTRGGGRRDVRSLVLTDSALEYLVHLHLLRNGHKPGVRSLSFREFIKILRERYGFCVDTGPPGMPISNEILRGNRIALERRLRDLGLLIGVNDAEAMKRLQPRLETAEEN